MICEHLISIVGRNKHNGHLIVSVFIELAYQLIFNLNFGTYSRG